MSHEIQRGRRPSSGFGRRTLLGGAAASAAGLLRATASPASAQTVVEDELRVVSSRIPPGLDPVHDGSDASGGYLRSVGAAEGLLRITPSAEVDLDLAAGYEMIDPFTWHVTLRPEVRFWSGRPVDAAAVVESLERSRALALPAAALLQGVRIESDSPIPGLPMNLAHEWLVIHNAQSYGPATNSFDVSAADLTGFFKVTAFEPRQRLLLSRNEHYWGIQPRMHRVRFEEIVDNDARALAALSGETHIARLLASSAAGQIERNRTVRLVSVTNASLGYVLLNTQKPPFDDVRVRQALAWAIDREEMVELAHDGRGTPYPSWLAAHPAYPEAKKTGYTRYDPARAAQLLDEAGWHLAPGGRVRAKNGVPLRFRLYWFSIYLPQAEVLQAQWGKIGVDVVVQGAVDSAFAQSRIEANDWDAVIYQWNTIGDPFFILHRHVGRDGVANFAKFQDAELDALLAGFADLVDPEERREQALKVNRRHAEVVPFIPLTSQDRLVAVNRRVRNYVPHFAPWIYEVHPDLWVSV
jgi:peptide/nickel transport system substrate-binding protein